MKINLKKITVRDLVKDYKNNGEDGVRGYGGKLDIRPPYQREFVYKDKQREAVIETVRKDFPLNVMYWSVRSDDTYEIIDGQQRTISISQYVARDFSVDGLYFHNLPDDKQKQILDYELHIYLCSGTDSEKLDWYKTINIAGEELLEQEIRNAVYAGTWVTEARKIFSKTGCPAYQIGKDYLTGSPIRQDYLETAIKWISSGAIEDYMGKRQNELSAMPLWEYFQSVIYWIETTFTNRSKDRKKLMKGLDWGQYYNDHKNDKLNPREIEANIAELMLDDEIDRPAGIYEYILTGEEKHLSLRAFKPGMKHRVYHKQEGICAICKKRFDIDQMEADHITPWAAGGKTNEDNCQMLCKKCNREKSSK